MIERHKKPGLAYVFSLAGLELPVVDVTHPAFRLSMTESEVRAQRDAFLKQNEPLGRLPRPLRDLVLRVVLRGSVIAAGLRQANGSFLSGMNTYLLKLGPENLGAYAKPIDRRIAAALPALAVRLRLQDMATLLANALEPALEAAPSRPLHFRRAAPEPHCVRFVSFVTILLRLKPLTRRSRCGRVLRTNEMRKRAACTGA